MTKWHCTFEQMQYILAISKDSFIDYKNDPSKAQLSKEQIDRLSYIVNIHATLRSIFTNSENVYNFMSLKNNNSYFNGRSPLEIISEGDFVELGEVFKRITAMREIN
ncbi:MAG: hypothetical protein P8H39_03290 [Thalassotalea sp.]|nr:hypothetical protein [Thalassotalea sp.]